jgi:serine/threonine protein kinase
VLLFEMLTGKHPFSARNRQLLQKKILSEKLKLPPYLTQEAAALLKGLLTREPKARLGTGEEGIDKVRSRHAHIDEHTAYILSLATTIAHPPLRDRRAHRRTSLSDS